MSRDVIDLSTEWNQAQAFQYRLHEISIRISQARRNNNYQGWTTELWNFFIEMSSQMSHEEITTIKQQLTIAEKKVNGPFPEKAFSILVDTDIQIRDIMRDRGMLVPAKDDPRRAIGG